VEIRASVIFTGGAQCRWDGEQEIEQKDPLFSILDFFEKTTFWKNRGGAFAATPKEPQPTPPKLPTRNSFCPSASETKREGLAYE
jgi:hypothetical protein